jgi:hypothetical protein
MMDRAVSQAWQTAGPMPSGTVSQSTAASFVICRNVAGNSPPAVTADRR